ncbi:MAG: VWA domain-containing protein [Desulfofustis sp.]
MLRFDQPLWLGVGPVCCVLLWVLLGFLDRRRSSRLRRFAAPALVPELTRHISSDKRQLKKYLLVSAALLCFTALARPQYGHRWIDVKHKGIDILFALDTSKSMLAEDIRPNRLERSKLAIMDFVSGLSGDRVGLLPFAGSAYLLCPLTADYQAFEQTLMSVDQTTIPDGGTDIGAAIDAALRTLTNEANHKFLIVITDGEVLQGDASAAARRAAEHHMVIHTVGVGTREGELIPNPEAGGFVQDNRGDFVKSRLDLQSLESIADATGGLSVLLGSNGQGLETIYRQKLALAPWTELAEKRTQIPIERFGWPLALAILLLSMELVLSERKNGRARDFLNLLPRRRRPEKPVMSALFVVLAALLLSKPSYLYSAEAEELYAKGNYTEAQQRYRALLKAQPADPRLLFNSGAAAYKSNDFEAAARDFEKALPTDDLQLQEKTYYNRGNALYRLGERQLKNDPAQVDRVIDSWEQAASSFDSALALNPDNGQARANRAFVKEKLEQLKREQRSRKSEAEQSEQRSEETQRNQSASDKRKSDETSGQQQKIQQQPKQTGDQGENRSAESERQGRDSSDPEQSRPATTEPEPGGDHETAASAGHSQSAALVKKATGSAALQTMSAAEAEQLLQSLEAEEGRMSIAAPSQNEGKATDKDW